MRLTRVLGTFGFLCALVTAPAWAGPPLICHALPIGSQASLPWAATQSWNGALASYDVSQLQRDTLALLAPNAPLDVRMETLNPEDWFDAGYFAETLRQAARIYPLLHGSERDQWMIRSEVQQFDGLAWLRMAARLGGGERVDSVIATVERAGGR